MPNIFFTADTHFGHARIIEYCHRPFGSFEEMDEAIIERFNSVMRPGDLLYHLGDVKWSSANFDATVGRLRNAKSIHLVLGNHDDEKLARRWQFTSICDLRTIHAANHHFMLCHYALRVWPGRSRGVMNLYGHSHNTLPGIGRQLDVGVDGHDFYPWELSELVEHMQQIPIAEGDVE